MKLQAVLVAAAAASAVVAGTIYEIPSTGGSIQSSWMYDQGYDANAFAWDSFLLPANGRVVEVQWQGKYLYNGTFGKAFGFSIFFYATNLSGYEPDCGIPNPLDEDKYLHRDLAADNCGEAFDAATGYYTYSRVLETPFSFEANKLYWIRIVADQHSVPEWAIGSGSAGNGSHFRYISGMHMFQFASKDVAFRMIGPTIEGTVDLQDYVAPHQGVAVKVQLEQAGVVKATATTKLASDGSFSIPTVEQGIYDVAISGPHWLRRRLSDVTLTSDGASGLAFSLINGDIDHDNAISVFDYSVLSDYFDRSSSDTGWSTVGSNGFAPKDADLDGDGAVTIFDYAVLSTNFDVSGD